MKYLKVLCVLSLSLLFINPTFAEAPEQFNVQPFSITKSIQQYARVYGSNADEILKIVDCESNFKQEAKGDFNNGVYLAVGIGQFHQGFWEDLEKEMGEHLSRYSVHDQTKVLAYAFSQGESYKRKWTSYVAYKNGGTYSFYSKLLKKNFTVVCK